MFWCFIVWLVVFCGVDLGCNGVGYLFLELVDILVVYYGLLIFGEVLELLDN